jgi:hypothetical protein
VTFAISNTKKVVKNSLRGFFDVQLPSGLKLNGCMLHEKEGRRWSGLPSREYVKPDGSKSWAPIVEIPDRADRDKFTAGFLPLVERALLP